MNRLTTSSTCRGAAFTPESIRGLLAGTKLQSRRLVKDVPEWATECGVSAFTPPGQFSARGNHPEHGPAEKFLRCPYGCDGGLLWVKETWRTELSSAGAPGIRYAADDSFVEIHPDAGDAWLELRNRLVAANRPLEAWRSVRNMPRWASRVALELVSVRVERLLAITFEDILAEGVVLSGHEERSLNAPNTGAWVSAVDGRTYPDLSSLWEAAWDSINGKHAPAASNPWVWRLQVKLLEVRS